MDAGDLRELLTPDGLRLLAETTAAGVPADPVKAVAALRAAGHAPALVSAVLTQVRLRAKARAKFGDFADELVFTPAGLEQASRLRVAAVHAGRFRDAGASHVVDLGCGIGADSLAFAAAGLRVTAVDADEVTAAVAQLNLGSFPGVDVVHGLAEEQDLPAGAAVYLDPARRTDGPGSRRISDPAAYRPRLDDAIAMAAGRTAGIKLGPGIDRALVPEDADAQWVSVDGDVVELALWFGGARRPGGARSALVLDGAGAHELAADADGADPVPRELGAYLHEPDGAVIRARQLGPLAERIGAGTIDPTIAYLTSDAPARSPFARSFAVTAVLPLDKRTLRREIAARGIGTLEIKKRGVDVDPAAMRTALAPRGDASATLILTRAGGRRIAVLAERVAPERPDGPERR